MCRGLIICTFLTLGCALIAVSCSDTGQPENGQENKAPQVSIAADQNEAMPGTNVGIKCTGSDPDGDPLTYDWDQNCGTTIASSSPD